MQKCSSKYLNLYSLDAVIKVSPDLDSALLLTNFGVVICDLDFTENDDQLNLSDLVSQTKHTMLDKEDVPTELIGDGSTISVKNAVVKYSNNFTMNFAELVIHSDSICGFSPIKRDSILNQI